MSEWYEYPHRAVGLTIQEKVSALFGPRHLFKEEITRALNLPKDGIKPDEWREISEFAVNAGADLFRSTLKKDMWAAVAIRDGARINTIHSNVRDNRIGLFPDHDIFHAVETYRLTGGTSASAEFTKLDERSRLTSPTSAVAELYPVLFLSSNWGKPLPVLIASQNGRRQIGQHIETEYAPSFPPARQMAKRLTNSPPGRPIDRQREYENLVEVIVIGNAIRSLRMKHPSVARLSVVEQNAIHDAFKNARRNPPPHYKQFAEKVFAQTDFSTVPRLFIDEFLACIRQNQLRDSTKSA